MSRHLAFYSLVVLSELIESDKIDLTQGSAGCGRGTADGGQNLDPGFGWDGLNQPSRRCRGGKTGSDALGLRVIRKKLEIGGRFGTIRSAR